MPDNVNKVGLDCKLYYDSGDHATPSYVLIPRAMDVTASVDFNTASFVSRQSRWEASAAGSKTMEVTFGYEWYAGVDTVFDALLGYSENMTPKRFLVLDSLLATAGAQGWRFYAIVSPPSINQPLQDGMTLDFTLRAARFYDSGAVVDPDWYEVS